jgi:hypothetical protein
MRKMLGNDVSQGSLDLECDRLSQAIDRAEFGRLQWAKNEGPMLARLVGLAHAALEDRSDVALTDEGSTNETKRFVLKVHNSRVVAITISLDGGRARVQADEIDRSPYRISEGLPLSVDFQQVDDAWMASTLQELFGRIQFQSHD